VAINLSAVEAMGFIAEDKCITKLLRLGEKHGAECLLKVFPRLKNTDQRR